MEVEAKNKKSSGIPELSPGAEEGWLEPELDCNAELSADPEFPEDLEVGCEDVEELEVESLPAVTSESDCVWIGFNCLVSLGTV